MPETRNFNAEVAAITAQFTEVMREYRPKLENGRLVFETITSAIQKQGGSMPQNELYRLRMDFLQSEENLLAISNRALVAAELLRKQNQGIAPLFTPPPPQGPSGSTSGA